MINICSYPLDLRLAWPARPCKSTPPKLISRCSACGSGMSIELLTRFSRISPRISCPNQVYSPFVQRTWIALELKKLPYQYIEINAYNKSKELLEVNPRGLVPAIRQGDWAIYESMVTLDYLEDISPDSYPLLPKDPKKRAEARLWAEFVCSPFILYRVHRYCMKLTYFLLC